MSSSSVVERVYIGGLDPARLTIQQVLERLQPAVRDQVELRDISFSRTSSAASYCHLDAVSLQEGSTALEIMGKLYNNVKWKGCKIKVQAAKPHFLERLEQERRDRKRQHLMQEEEKPAPLSILKDKDDTTKNTAAITIIPRHLKVKRGYGEESWKVDTKPCRVTDWSSFAKMRNRLIQKQQEQPKPQRQHRDGKKKKQQQDQQQRPSDATVTLQKPAYRWNRAVHLQFSTSSSSSIQNNGDSRKLQDTKTNQNAADRQAGIMSDDASVSSSGSSSAISSSDEGESSSEQANAHGENKKRYIWSDSSASGNSFDSDDEHDRLGHANTNHVSEAAAVVADSDKWNKLTAEEFAAGIDHDEENGSVQSREHTSLSIDGYQDSMDNHLDLQQDVRTNLNVLANLFPDLLGTQPADLMVDVQKQQDDDDNKPTTDKNTSSKKTMNTAAASGWGSKGQIMLRYDPSKQSAGQFELEQNVEDDKEAEDEGFSVSDDEIVPMKDDGSDPVDTLNAEAEPLQEYVEESSNVYEQGKLEQVFRQAREEDSGGVVAASYKDGDFRPANEGGFSFGFLLDANDKNDDGKGRKKLNDQGEFSFSFNAPETAKVENIEENSQLRQAGQNSDAPANNPTQSETVLGNDQQKTKCRRRGLFFADEDLDFYVDHFYSLNDGKRIMEDLQGYSNDPIVEKSWEKQRRILTLDWKNKRKRAQAKRRKRF